MFHLFLVYLLPRYLYVISSIKKILTDRPPKSNLYDFMMKVVSDYQKSQIQILTLFGTFWLFLGN